MTAIAVAVKCILILSFLLAQLIFRVQDPTRFQFPAPIQLSSAELNSAVFRKFFY
jgi:hypothetical protein